MQGKLVQALRLKYQPVAIIWSDRDIPGEFPAGHADEEIIVGNRAWRRWKAHFSLKRQYAK